MIVNHTIAEPARRTPLAGESDVVVVGGGPAGIAAAVASARSGARTRLFDVNGCLGGVWTAGQLAWLFEMDHPGIPREITARLDRRGARIGAEPALYSYDIETMKLLLEEMLAEAGVEFQLHTRVVGAVVRDGAIRAVLTESKSGRQAWTAGSYVDASGDGDLSAQAGCEFDVGKPDSGQCQPMTFMGLIAVPDVSGVWDSISFRGGDLSYRQGALDHFRAELRRAGADVSYSKPTLFQVRGGLLALMVNHEYGVSATDAAEITRATVGARRELHRVVDALAGLGGGWTDLQLVATCEHIGVREGRRVRGRYLITADDLREGRRHRDGVCRVAFGVDVHCTDPRQGKGQEQTPFRVVPYDIPLRALIARDIPNLLMAGRCISGDFIAHSSYRVTGAAAATGQAAGVAAALSAQQGTPPADLPWETISAALQNV